MKGLENIEAKPGETVNLTAIFERNPKERSDNVEWFIYQWNAYKKLKRRLLWRRDLGKATKT